MLAGLGQAGVHLLFTVAACAALWAHAVMGAVLVHTVPTSLTQLLQPHPYIESHLRNTFSSPCSHHAQHHPTSPLLPVTRVPPHSIRSSRIPPNCTVLVTDTHTHLRCTYQLSHTQMSSQLSCSDGHTYHPGRLSQSHTYTHSAIHIMPICSIAP